MSNLATDYQPDDAIEPNPFTTDSAADFLRESFGLQYGLVEPRRRLDHQALDALRDEITRLETLTDPEPLERLRRQKAAVSQLIGHFRHTLTQIERGEVPGNGSKRWPPSDAVPITTTRRYLLDLESALGGE